ncbi:MAG: CocE/NonD family hydrolase [Saprospirales bacterium]|nr:CocE/NonD family hydrolase [Saprospirales bacterium]
MRDGTKLFTSYYLPKDLSKKYPILMIRTPYNSEPSAEGINVRILKTLTHLIEAGYIIVLQDVRGRMQSEGTFEDVRPYIPEKKTKSDVDESSDTYDAIDWLVKNVPHNNGRVGIFGISYPGFYATMSLLDAHPALKAVSPQAPVTDWYIGDDFHHNGAFFMMDAVSFFSGFGLPRPAPTRSAKWGFPWPNQDNYQFFLDMGPVRNITERYFGDSIKFWNDAMRHPNYDDFWQARNPRPHLKNVKPAVLTVGGFFDAEDCFGAQHVYEAIETQNPDSISNRVILGPWSHGQWEREPANHLGNIYYGWNTGDDFKKLERQFFDFYLKDEGTMDIPEATIFLTGANKWQGFDAWPPKNAVDKSLYFHPAGGLSFEAPTGTNASFEEYMSDPMKPVPYTEDVHLHRTREYMTDDQRFAARRPDVLVFQTGILEEDITLTGPLTADLWVSTTGTDADYVVKLIDVFPDTLQAYPENEKGVPMAGYQMLVRGEVMRGRYRNSFEKPEPFTPGEVTRVTYTLPDVGHTFQKGHRIMIQVQNSWFPLVDRNPQKFVDIYHCGPEDFQKATHRVYFDAERPSRVAVKVLR